MRNGLDIFAKFHGINVAISNIESQEGANSFIENYVAPGNIQDMKTLADRLRSRMKELGITHDALAIRLGMSRTQITQYLSGRRIPPTKKIERIEKEISVPPGWLLYGDEVLERRDTAIPVSISHQKRKFPLLRDHDVVDWVKRGRLPEDYQEITIGILGEPVSDRSFFMQVSGDAMHNKENPQSIANGEYVLVEPDSGHKPGSLVVIADGKKDVKIRQYQVDGSQVFYKAFDPQIKHIEGSALIEIMGEITQVTRFLKKNNN